jgi:tetratricopeptide (TPR) repeat protein
MEKQYPMQERQENSIEICLMMRNFFLFYSLKATELDPTYDKAFYRLGEAYMEYNELELAKKYYLEAIKINSKSAQLREALERVKKKIEEEKQLYKSQPDKQFFYGKFKSGSSSSSSSTSSQ